MQMYIDYLRAERQTMMEHNIRFRQIGRLENLPDPVLEEVDRTLAMTKANDGLTLVLALELQQPRRDCGWPSAPSPARSSRGTFGRKTSASAPSPNTSTPPACPTRTCLIRTAGEMRVSNYLLWQISYAELFVSDVLC